MPIKMLSKFVKRDNRTYITFRNQMGKVEQMPFANYVWLKSNPAFIKIPKGYVIHHLDENEANDDITNLVLMQKHHHAAYHFKNKKIETKVEIDWALDNAPERDVFFPLHEPYVDEYKPGRWRLRFAEKINGERTRVQMYRWKGIMFDSKEIAEKAKRDIWDPRIGPKPCQDLKEPPTTA